MKKIIYGSAVASIDQRRRFRLLPNYYCPCCLTHNRLSVGLCQCSTSSE